MDIKISAPRNGTKLKAIITRAYPMYNGRKYVIRPQERIGFHDNYWSGGSKTYYTLVNMDTLEMLPIDNAEAPWTALAMEKMENREIPRNALIIAHVIFCGKDLGMKLYVHPEGLNQFQTEILGWPLTGGLVQPALT